MQEDRIDLLKHALEQKIGSDPANKHYDSAAPTTLPENTNESGLTQTTNNESPRAGEADIDADDEGLYL